MTAMDYMRQCYATLSEAQLEACRRRIAELSEFDIRRFFARRARRIEIPGRHRPDEFPADLWAIWYTGDTRTGYEPTALLNQCEAVFLVERPQP